MQLRELLKNQQILAPVVSAKNTSQQSDLDAFSQLLANKNEKMTDRPDKSYDIAARRNNDNPKFVKDLTPERKFDVKVKAEVSDSSEYKTAVVKPKESDYAPVEKTDAAQKDMKTKKVDAKDENSNEVNKLKDELKAKLKKETGLSDAQLDQLLATMSLNSDSLKQLLAGGEVTSELFAELAETIENLEIDEALDKNLTGSDLAHLKKQLNKLVEILDKFNIEGSTSESDEPTETSLKTGTFETKVVQALSKIVSDLNAAVEATSEEAPIRPEDIRKAILQAIAPVQANQNDRSVEKGENAVASTVPSVATVSSPQSSALNSGLNGEEQANQNLTPSATPNAAQVAAQTQVQPQAQSLTGQQAETAKQDDVQTEADVKTVEGISMHQVAMKQGNAITTAAPQQSPQLKQEIFTQIIDAIRGHIKLSDHGTSLLVKLQPEQLGNVELKLNIHKGVVLAEIKVENEIVKAAIESNLDDLKQSLSNKGYSVDQINVNVDSGKKDRQEAFEFNQQERRNRQNQKNEEIGNLEPIETSNKYIINEYEGSTINYYG